MKTKRAIFTAIAMAIAFIMPLRADEALDGFKKEKIGRAHV